MSLSGIRTPLATAYGLAPAARPAAPKPSAPVTAPVATTAATTTERPEAPPAMPRGADPQLWSVLTSEEKGYFAKQAALGPLTYGPTARLKDAVPAAMQAPRGLRLDVSA